MSSKPSILLIVLDAFRADCAPFAEPSPHLRSLGLRPPEMPALTAFVRDAHIFTQALACASHTLPCHASLFTGLLPPEHGLRAYRVDALSSEVRTLAEILANAGYATCAMSDQVMMFHAYGLLRGFQTILTTEDEAFSWWESYEGMPRFLFMHLWDAHRPHNMPMGHRYRSLYPDIIRKWEDRLRSINVVPPARDDRFQQDPERYYVSIMQFMWADAQGYKAALTEYLDGLVTFDHGRLADILGWFRAHHVLGTCIVVVTADHGDGRQNPPSQRVNHGFNLLDDVIRIPLYLCLPGTSGGRRISDQVSQVDIAPTILDLIGLLNERTPPRTAYNGRSLVPLLHGKVMPERLAYAETRTAYTETPEPEFPDEDVDVHVREPGSSIPRYQVIRYPNRKYWLTGKHLDISPEILSLPDDDLVRFLFRDLAAQSPSVKGRDEWLSRLKAIPRMDSQRRLSLIQEFERSGPLRHRPRHAIYDLKRDPLELHPVDARRKPADWAEFQPQLEIMLELDRCARSGQRPADNEADERIILRHLRNLGYIE